MEYASGLHFAGAVLEISVIDLMLSADNALIIAMCCSSLPAAHVRTAVVLGAAGAIVLRGLLTMVAGLLLQIPYLKYRRRGAGGDRHQADRRQRSKRPVGRRGARTTSRRRRGRGGRGRRDDRRVERGRDVRGGRRADEFDNIVALGAIAQGSALLLIFGLLLSIPLLVFGGLLVVGLLETPPRFW